MKIQILGTGCPKCKALEQHAREAVAELGLEASQVGLLEASVQKEGWEAGAWDSDIAQRAREADGIWILGGNQAAIMARDG